jgi:multidrug efflux system membrane fusion protein
MSKKESQSQTLQHKFKELLQRYNIDDAKHHKTIRNTLWLLSILIISFLIWRFIIEPTNHKRMNKPAVSVVVATVKQGELPVYISALGSVIPTDNITIKTQINGLLMRFLVEEGQTVKEGQRLAEIDSRLYEAQLLQYEGQLIRDNALLANAKLDLERYQALYAQNAVSKQILDTQVWLVKQYEGNEITDKGLIETAKVNIAYCHIISPITGRVGLRQVDPGNFVQTSDPNGIIVINALSPITVVFSIPEDYVPEILHSIECLQPLKIDAYDRWQNNRLATTNAVVLDNLIDTSTGTLKLKAQYDNKDGKLFPNQFVNIQLQLKILQDAIIVPTAAVQYGTQGPFVFTVSNDQKAQVRPITVAGTYKDDTAILGKVNAGEIVVIEGMDKLADGLLVKVSSKITNQTRSKNDDKQKGGS